MREPGPGREPVRLKDSQVRRRAAVAKRSGQRSTSLAADSYPSLAAGQPEVIHRAHRRTGGLNRVRLLSHRQRLCAPFRADVSATATADLRDQLEACAGRCSSSFRLAIAPGRASIAAAPGSSLALIPPTPIHLSATKKHHRKNLPGTPRGGSSIYSKGITLVSLALRPAGMVAHIAVISSPSRRTFVTPSGATGLDSKTGAAIQRTVSPAGLIPWAR